MKRLILPVIVTLSTLTSLVYKAPASAAINSRQELDSITELTTVETENTPQLSSMQIDSETEEVAYYPVCYWQYYPNGVALWVCY